MSKSNQNLALIDIFSVARNRKTVQTQIKVTDMPELVAFLCDVADDDTFSVEIVGVEGARGLPGAILSFKGEVNVPCTHCMKSIAVTVEREVPFLFVKTEAEANRMPIDEDEDWEITVGSSHMNIADWVQEEAILSLPAFPKHETCEANEMVQKHKKVQEDVKKPNPFANLRALMQKN